MTKGFLSIILHAHLPYVRHPEYDSFFEENWLFEAITECYVPLVAMLDRLQADKVDYRLTLSISPTLITMLQDDLLQMRYLQHLTKLQALSEQEIHRTRKQPEFHKLACLYRRFFLDTQRIYQQQYRCDLLAAFKKHQAAGNLCIITTAATHSFLPLLNSSETAVRNQIEIGIDTFNAYFGFNPDGFWLPECGYYPGLENTLKEVGIDYFFVDSHGILDASEQPHNAVYAPLDCGNGVAVFGRDPASSRQVWSSQEGYPGDVDYREYYRDIGFDLPLDYITPYLPEDQSRSYTGIKYHKVTGNGKAKEIYQPEQAITKARQHAHDFIQQRQQQSSVLSQEMDRPPVIIAPYDAELFGHWWFEGPQWLENVLRLVAKNNHGLQLLTCSEYLAQYPRQQQAVPSASSWGQEGYSSYWINESNDWIYPLIHKADANMAKLVSDLQGLSLSDLQKRTLNQAFRSILLAQASDWPFIMKSGTTTEYAEKRITDHLARFNYLHECIRKNRIDERYLTALEIMDDIFPDIDYRNYVRGTP